MKRYPDSIISDDMTICLVCGTRNNLHVHHVFGGANRKHSTKYGLVVALCIRHHNGSNEGVHHNKVLDNKLKKHAQKIAMQKYSWGENDFRKIFGKSYL